MTLQRTVNVARWLTRSSVNGPGERFVIWVQGCPLHCPGCWNPDTWSNRPNQLMSVAQLLGIVERSLPMDGVTLTGGEPFAQADALAEFAHALRPLGLSLMAFTGYDLAELQEPGQLRLLGLLDVVVTGRFDQALKCDGLLWRGSSNQRVHYLSDRHREHPALVSDAPVAEVLIEPSGGCSVTGFPSAALLQRLTTGVSDQR